MKTIRERLKQAAAIAFVTIFLCHMPRNVFASTNTPPAEARDSLAAGATNEQPIAATNEMAALDDKHILAAGDQISFRIVEDGEGPQAMLVTDSGELEVPYIGRVPAVGKSCRQLAYQLKATLEREYYYHATVVVAVNVMAKSRGKVYLVGPVRAPGPQDVPSDEVLTVSKAILRAGGFTDFADRRNVKVTRKGSGIGAADHTFIVNVGKVLEKGTTESDLVLEPGDLIYIPDKLIRF